MCKGCQSLLMAELTCSIATGYPPWFNKEQLKGPVVIKLFHRWTINTDSHAGCQTVALQPVPQVCLDLYTEMKLRLVYTFCIIFTILIESKLNGRFRLHDSQTFLHDLPCHTIRSQSQEIGLSRRKTGYTTRFEGAMLSTLYHSRLQDILKI